LWYAYTYTYTYTNSDWYGRLQGISMSNTDSVLSDANFERMLYPNGSSGKYATEAIGATAGSVPGWSPG
jgi:hypothetical protein